MELMELRPHPIPCYVIVGCLEASPDTAAGPSSPVFGVERRNRGWLLFLALVFIWLALSQLRHGCLLLDEYTRVKNPRAAFPRMPIIGMLSYT